MSRGLRSLVHHPLRSSGVGRGGAEVPEIVEMTLDWDGETAGQPPSQLAAEVGADTSEVIVDSIEGHTRTLNLPYASGSTETILNLGKAYNFSNGVRVQFLAETTGAGKYNLDFGFQSVKTGLWDGSNYLYAFYSQGENPDILRGMSKLNDTVYDTGTDSTGYEGSTAAWHYVRFEWIPSANFEGAFYTTSGGHDDGSPFSSTWAVQPSAFSSSLQYIWVRSKNAWYGLNIAEIWIAPRSTAWPTPGTPTS